MDETDPLPWWGWTGAGLAVVAMALELARVTLVWPTAVRAGWWTAVTVGVAGWHLARHRTGDRPNLVVAVGSVLLFATFTVGVATSAEWAAWH